VSQNAAECLAYFTEKAENTCLIHYQWWRLTHWLQHNLLPRRSNHTKSSTVIYLCIYISMYFILYHCWMNCQDVTMQFNVMLDTCCNASIDISKYQLSRMCADTQNTMLVHTKINETPPCLRRFSQHVQFHDIFDQQLHFSVTVHPHSVSVFVCCRLF